MATAASLTRAEVRKALKKLRELDVKPPRVGYCVTVVARDSAKTSASSSIHYDPGAPVVLCRNPKSRYIPNDTGYQIVTLRREHGLFGRSGRRRRKSMTAAQLRDKLACKIFGGKACR